MRTKTALVFKHPVTLGVVRQLHFLHCLTGFQYAHSSFFMPLAVCHPYTHTDTVSIMAGCCLHSDPIFSDRRRTICFVCHTKRGNAVQVQVDQHSTQTQNTSDASIGMFSNRLLMSTQSLINWTGYKPLYLLVKSRLITYTRKTRLLHKPKGKKYFSLKCTKFPHMIFNLNSKDIFFFS